jgi:hypothetical protein
LQIDFGERRVEIDGTPTQGYRLKGWTPTQALREAVGIERPPAFAPPVDQHESDEETVPAQTN